MTSCALPDIALISWSDTIVGLDDVGQQVGPCLACNTVDIRPHRIPQIPACLVADTARTFEDGPPTLYIPVSGGRFKILGDQLITTVIRHIGKQRRQIGRASCRERVWSEGEGVSLKQRETRQREQGSRNLVI